MNKFFAIGSILIFIFIAAILIWLFNSIVRLVDYVFSVEALKVIAALVVILVTFLVTRGVAKGRSLKFKLWCIFFLFLFFILSFGTYYHWVFRNYKQNGFQISSDYTRIYGTQLLENNLQKKELYLNYVFLMQFMKIKQDSVYYVIKTIYSTLSGNHSICLKGDIYFIGSAFLMKTHDGLMSDHSFYIKDKDKVVYVFDKERLSGNDYTLTGIGEKFLGAQSPAETSSSLDQFIEFYTGQVARLDESNYLVVTKGQLRLSYADFLLFSASTMIPVGNPGFIPVGNDVKILMILQSLLGVFLIGFGVEALWTETKRKNEPDLS